jgi:two-component system sensor histidine kinase/response regulator
MQLDRIFDIKTASNGLQALEIVQLHPIDYFDAILLDINMPVMNGFDACKEIFQFLKQGFRQ